MLDKDHIMTAHVYSPLGQIERGKGCLFLEGEFRETEGPR